MSSDLCRRKIAAQFVPKVMREEQMERRVTVAMELREKFFQELEFLKKIVTGDTTWAYLFDPETKQQSSQWKLLGSPRPKKARRSWSTKNVMLHVTLFLLPGSGSP